jgi:hypothetical protein
MRVKLLEGIDDGVWGVWLWMGARVNEVPFHNIPAHSELVPFKVSRDWSRIEVDKDVVQLRQEDVRGISLERLLCNCPVCHHKEQSVLV